MKLSTLGTVITMVGGIGSYTLVFAVIVLASHAILPEDPDNILFNIVASILVVMLVGAVVGIFMSWIGDKRERKKQNINSDAQSKKNTIPL